MDTFLYFTKFDAHKHVYSQKQLIQRTRQT